MTTTEDAKVLSLTVVFLRFFAGMTQAELGRAAGIDQGLISRYESGKHVPPEESLRRIAAAAGVPWSQVIFLRPAYATILASARRKAGGLDTEPLDAGGLEISLERVLLVVATYLDEETSSESSPEEERREAERIWEALEELPASRRRRLIELSLHAGRSWALAERLCEASLRMRALASAGLLLGPRRPRPPGGRRPRRSGRGVRPRPGPLARRGRRRSRPARGARRPFLRAPNKTGPTGRESPAQG